ncbi:MAG: hypothetical protein OHK0029_24820 [Armatimonadaceae bacterium]
MGKQHLLSLHLPKFYKEKEMADRKVVLEKIVVHNNGDRMGKGELYWAISANSQEISLRDRKNPHKTKDGETIFLGDHLTVSNLTDSDTLKIDGWVSEKDGVLSGSDEKADFSHIYSRRDNWGMGSYDVRLQDHPLDVTLSYRIEDL